LRIASQSHRKEHPRKRRDQNEQHGRREQANAQRRRLVLPLRAQGSGRRALGVILRRRSELSARIVFCRGRLDAVQQLFPGSVGRLGDLALR
jgi:hypothetical protein